MDEFSELEKQVAQKLFASYKQSMERQGVDYAFWDTLSKYPKRAWLETARDFLQSLTGK